VRARIEFDEIVGHEIDQLDSRDGPSHISVSSDIVSRNIDRNYPSGCLSYPGRYRG
jgi:hypothetical protein